MLRFQKLILIVLLLTVSACSQNSIEPPEATNPKPAASATPWFAGTETALAASNATPTMEGAGTATPPALPTFAFTTAPTMGFSPPPEGTFSPVLYGSKDSSSFLVVGGIKKDHGWLSSAQAAQFIGSEMVYDFLVPTDSFRFRAVSPNLGLPAKITL